MNSTQTINYPERIFCWKEEVRWRNSPTGEKVKRTSKQAEHSVREWPAGRKEYQPVTMLCWSDGAYRGNKGEADWQNEVYSDNRIEICWKFGSGFFDTKTMHK